MVQKNAGVQRGRARSARVIGLAIVLTVAGVVPLLGSTTRAMTPSEAGTLSPRPVATGTGTSARRASWAPAPVPEAGLATLATGDARGLRLRTSGGERSYLAGVNLGATTPGHFPGELSITAAQYRDWFAKMGSLGIRSVRIYTIHPPAFYTELAAYNRAHPDAPIYLMQGVYLPNERYVDAAGTLFDPQVDDAFTEEIADATKAVRGALTRAESPGRAAGTWTADVSPWLVGWLIGVEWDPEAVKRTDAKHADAPAVAGRYFRSTADATPTERWLAGHLDALATIEARNGISMPIAFVNWPSTDPLSHPDEPHPAEDLVGIDANHVLPTANWPGGTFASYHAYPYYPDFLRYEPGLSRTVVDGRPDPYAGYLAALRAHHPAMPVLITETGVPSSLGSAHAGPLGRDQGGLSETEAMAIDARLLRMVREQGLAGAYLFAWADEWFKLTWNTVEHQIPAANRPRWHDPLTNEQYFGLLATDPNPLDGADDVVRPAAGSGIEQVGLDADASYVYLTVRYTDDNPDRDLELAVDTVPGGAPTERSGGAVSSADYRISVDPAANRAQAQVRAGLDPTRFDTWEDLPDAGSPWHDYRLVTNRSYANRSTSNLETQDVGRLIRGVWQPDSPRADSRATWQTTGDSVRLRIPWAMLGLSDPSSRTALGEGASPAGVAIEGLGFTLSVGGHDPVTIPYTWPTWDPDDIAVTERLKAGVDQVGQAFREVNR